MSRRAEGDAKLRVSFFTDAIEDQAATEQAGRPVFKEIDWIRIIVPADKETDQQGWEDVFVVNESYKRRFPDEYAEFKRGQADPTSGTPIKTWPAVSIAVVNELASFGIKTVEQLAAVEGKELRLNEWLAPHVKKAQVWLASINDTGIVLKLEAKVTALEKEVELLKTEKAELITELSGANTALKALTPKSKKAAAAE